MSEPKTIIRTEKGQPDDVVIEDVSYFRLERMNAGHVWIAAYRGGKRVTLGLYSKRKIEIEIIEDDLGCVDDTRQ